MCFGGGGRTAVFYNERVYVRDPSVGNLTLDSGTGIRVAEFQSLPAPAFRGSTGFFLGKETLRLGAEQLPLGTFILSSLWAELVTDVTPGVVAIA